MNSDGLVVVVCGPACSGKSVFAPSFASKLSLKLVNHDDVLTEIKPKSDRNPTDRLKACVVMHRSARELNSLGQGVLLEGTYSRRGYRSDLLSALPEAFIYIIEMRVPVEVALERFGKRRDHPGIDLTAESVRELTLTYPYWNSAISINGTLPYVEQERIALAAVNGRTAQNLSEWEKLGLSTAVTD